MKYLVTGGAGFIGCNTVKRLIERGNEVVVFDTLSRLGAKSNLEWLQQFGKFVFVKGDVRDYDTVVQAFREHSIDVVIHLAGQVAVTTSIACPREDFEINALGTFNVLEAIRQVDSKPILLNASTNKVYGGMEDVEVIEKDKRYEYKNLPNGISENRPLDFHSPYGCSKGCADQYVIDYARTYGLQTVNFRQSCIYGYRQFGMEDQGWVAWFTIASMFGKPITIYGDGKQVRDILFIDDLVDSYLMAIKQIDVTAGQSYNIGGGIENQISLLELLDILESLLGKEIPRSFSDGRAGDQRIFVCDIGKARDDFGWLPQVCVEEGINRLFSWVSANKDLFI